MELVVSKVVAGGNCKVNEVHREGTMDCLTISVLDKIQDTFQNGSFGTGCLCIQVCVECGIGQINASDVLRQLDAKCTTVFHLTSMYYPHAT